MIKTKRFFLATGLASILFFTGCLDIDVLVKVRPDGSGSIHETIMMQDAMISIAESIAKSSGDKSEIKWKDKNTLEKNAKNYGEGVVFKETRELKRGEMRGYTVVYEFTDIQKVKLDINPDEKLPRQVVESTGTVKYKKAKEPMHFTFSKGPVATLTISNPLDTMAFSYPETDNPIINSVSDTTFNDMFVGKLAEMFGFKIRFAVEPVGKIIKTNSTNRYNKQIVLFGLDFGEVLKNRKKMDEVKKNKPKTFAELKNIAPLLKGVELPFEEKIIIQFK
ncbi:MAG: hypothetical protein HYV28_06210 [Ignavibacteriales bacterium]|nr:hypothetical protein [Ignavibacteriales bacterium]